MLTAIALSVVAVVYNNVVNRWPPFHGGVYVPVNLAFALAVAAVAALGSDLTTAELGLRGDVADLTLPVVLVAVVALGGLGVASSSHAHRIADERVTRMKGRALAWYVAARIPLGTAVAEELVFRGALLAAWRAAGASVGAAALASSAAFGLWHVAPTVIGLRMNEPGASRRKVRTAIFGAVVLTTLAGLGLVWLREETGGLVAPIALHAGINSAGALAAAAAGRRTGDP